MYRDGQKKNIKDDAELVAAAMAGGPEAFGLIVERYQDAVFGIVLARLRNFHDAEDVAQSVFVEAFSSLGKLKDPLRLGAWLRSIAIHHSIDYLRQRRRIVSVEEISEPADNLASPQDQLEKMELREQVLTAIGCLSKVQRETTTLFYINGYSQEEVATMQEVPVGTVKRRLHDARKSLKKEMMSMVEGVLKDEAPKKDFSERVFWLISRYRMDNEKSRMEWYEIAAELRKIGTDGIEGFIRALESPHSPTRAMAIHMLQVHHAPQKGKVVVELLKRALTDSNKKVRSGAVGALLHTDVGDERKRKEFVPLVIPLLTDPSKRVRRAASWALSDWAQAVPIKEVATALLFEKDQEIFLQLKCLMKKVLNSKEKSKK